MSKDKLTVCETFPAIQGEGITIGKPVQFLRLSYCSLKCPWCDTQYYNEGSIFSIDEVIKKLRDSGMKDIVITGGEPMLQKEAMFNLMCSADDLKYHLETNGTIYDDRMKKFDTISCSPKRFAKDNPEISNKLSKLENITYKFVYEPGIDKWWEEYMNKCQIGRDRIYIMPLGATREEQIKNMPEVIEYCIKNKYKFSARLQVIAYDTKRGV